MLGPDRRHKHEAKGEGVKHRWCLRVDLLKLQARKIDREKTTVSMNMAHLIHLYSGMFGSNDMTSMPTKGKRQQRIMMYSRWFWNF